MKKEIEELLAKLRVARDHNRAATITHTKEREKVTAAMYRGHQMAQDDVIKSLEWILADHD